MAVGKHFGDISEDQFDFHSYCIRKMTLRAYIAMLRLEDGLYGHAFYSKVWQAACCGCTALCISMALWKMRRPHPGPAVRPQWQFQHVHVTTCAPCT